jgi:hypothetical protein
MRTTNGLNRAACFGRTDRSQTLTIWRICSLNFKSPSANFFAVGKSDDM